MKPKAAEVDGPAGPQRSVTDSAGTEPVLSVDNSGGYYLSVR